VRSASLAALVCAPMFFRARPQTPLRVVSIGAFEYFARLRGTSLGALRRFTIACACDLGGLRDRFYDDATFDRAEYRELRSLLRRLAPESATTHYLRSLRFAERNRPVVVAGEFKDPAAVIAYRTGVLEITLSWLRDIAKVNVDHERFRALLAVASLVQLVDDILDWKDDSASAQPSYVTATLKSGKVFSREAAVRVRLQADRQCAQLITASRRDVAVVPIAIAGLWTWIIIVVLLKIGFLHGNPEPLSAPS
jgi:hypothetical protein